MLSYSSRGFVGPLRTEESLGLRREEILAMRVVGFSLINARCKGEGSVTETSVRCLVRQTHGMLFLLVGFFNVSCG